MYKRALTLCIGLISAIGLNSASADTGSDLKALQDQKSMFDAQAARDTAEAGAIKAASDLANARSNSEKSALDAKAARDASESAAVKAATDLANAKALGGDIDKSSFDAKAARDTAEATAVKAAADLAKAKGASNSIDANIAKSQYDAETQLTASKIGAQTAELAALKGVFGSVPSLGTEGNVSITDSSTGMLLETKSGSLRTTWVLAEKFCERLKASSVKGAYIAPANLDSKILASKFVLKEFNDIKTLVDQGKVQVAGDTTSQLSSVGVLGAVSMLQYGAGALQTIAKLFNSDYAVAVSDGKRETWLEYFVSARCPEELPKADVESVVRNGGFANEIKSLNEFADFADKVNSRKAVVTRKVGEAIQAIAKKKTEDPKAPVDALMTDLSNQQSALDALSKFDGLVTRIKALVDLVASKPEAFIDALVWDKFSGTDYKDKSRISFVFTSQDGQVTKTNWLFGKSIYGRSAGELVYRVMDSAGNVITVGYLIATNSTGEFNFKASAGPVAEGPSYPPPTTKSTQK